MSTLCIIDMQDHFLETKEARKTIPRVVHEVELAKKRNASILILEYRNHGKTNKKVMNAIGKHPHVNLKKRTDGGGYELQEFCRKKKISIQKLRLCGVNRGYCVFATALELLYIEPGIKLESAVNASWCYSPVKGLRLLGRVSRLLFHGKQIDKKEINLKKRTPFSQFHPALQKEVWYDVIDRYWSGKYQDLYIPDTAWKTIKE